jgi:serine/threonine protein kinase
VSGYIPKEVNLSPEFKSIVTSMLAPEACHRPTITELREHPWFNGPIATHEEIVECLKSRKAKVEEENERQRLAKALEKRKKEELVAKQTSPSKATTTLVRASIVGNKPYRGIEEEEEAIDHVENIEKVFKSLLIKKNIKNECYLSNAPYFCIQFVSLFI